MNILRVKAKEGIKSILTYWYKRQRYRVRLKGVNLSSDAEKRVANEAIADIHRQVDSAGRPADMTVSQFVPVYKREMMVNQRVDPSRNKSVLDVHIVPFFGDRPLISLKKEDGLDYIVHRRKKLAAEGTIEREWAVLMALLNSAVENECLDKNRLRSVRSPKGTRRKRIATQEELARIRGCLGEARNKRDREAGADALRLMEAALHTGLRVSKLLAVEVPDLVQLPDGWWLKLPDARTATKDNPELIPLNAPAVSALRGPSSRGRVFQRWKDAGSFKPLWNRLLTRAKVVDLHFHDLRHTFTTWLQDCGVSLEVRQMLLGHRVKGTTFEYSHGGKALMREAVKKLESLPHVAPLVLTLPKWEWRKSLKALVPRDRIELSTPAFSGLCSAN
jgi:integrase